VWSRLFLDRIRAEEAAAEAAGLDGDEWRAHYQSFVKRRHAAAEARRLHAAAVVALNLVSTTIAGRADEDPPEHAADEPSPLVSQLVDVLDAAPGAPSRPGAPLLAA
jgi:hypothetical protein